MKNRRPAELDDKDRCAPATEITLQRPYGIDDNAYGEPYLRPLARDEQADVRLMSAREADAAKYRDLLQRSTAMQEKVTTLRKRFWFLCVGYLALGCSIGMVVAMAWQRVH